MPRIPTSNLPLPPQPTVVGRPAQAGTGRQGQGQAPADRFQRNRTERYPARAAAPRQAPQADWAFDVVVLGVILGLIVLGLMIGGNMVALGIGFGWATVALFLLIRKDLTSAWHRFLR